MPVIFDRIKSLCDQKGTSIANLETENKFGNSTIRKWGSENSSPRLDKLEIVANYLDTSVAYLIGETDNPSRLVETGSKIIVDSEEPVTNEQLAQIQQFAEYITKNKVFITLGNYSPKPLSEIKAKLEALNKAIQDFETTDQEEEKTS